jgi:hypothetical protein
MHDGEWQACWLPDNHVWRPVDITQEQGEAVMAGTELIGFTLFDGNKGWQMSTRRRGEAGWSVTHISADEAATVLAQLEPIGHPDGPWRVKAGGLSIVKYIEPPAGADVLSQIAEFEASVKRLTAVVEAKL